MTTLFTSESVSEGHPDKVCDAISDTLTDLFISKDSFARTAIETMATTNRVIISGETSSQENISPSEIESSVRETIRKIGYEQPNFHWKTFEFTNLLHQQSSDIAMGVNNNGAGDQGIMFGYAKAEKGFDCCYMPLAIGLAHKILKKIKDGRQNGELKGLGPDAKSQVTVEYNDNKEAIGIKSIVVSSQHEESLSQRDVREMIIPVIQKVLPEGWLPKDENIFINPTGRFVIGGPEGDTGLTGRKIIVDTYGGYAPHGGGAFSGKDPTKVDRSAAYMLRYLAKNIVAAGLAEQCLLQISYAIGVAKPLSLYINTFGSAKTDEQQILKSIENIVDLTPQGIIKHLNLRRPIYAPTAAYGHFGRTPLDNGCFSWEKLDLIKDIQKCL